MEYVENDLKPTPEVEQEENTETPVDTKEYDFEGKDFEETQKMISATARLNSLNGELDSIKNQKNNILSASIANDSNVAEDVIQMHLDKFEDIKSLQVYLTGDVNNEKVKNRINEFFTNDETGEVLVMAEGNKGRTEADELEFKRGLLLYFKENDFYLQKIDEETAKLEEATREFNSNMSKALNPLKDNILVSIFISQS